MSSLRFSFEGRGKQNQNLALKRIQFHIAAATLNTAEKGAAAPIVVTGRA